MGTGIAITSIKAGLPTVIVDTSEAALESAKKRVERYFARETEKGRMEESQVQTARQCLTMSTDLQASADRDIVVEAVFEDITIKRDLILRLQPLLRPETIIATNTSCLLVSDIAHVLNDPGRMLGLHYFSPAEISPTVEVISTSETRARVREDALAFLIQTGKSPLPCRDSPGFALNRFFCPYCNEAVRILEEEIASEAQIDAVACEIFGVPAGPFRVMNITKPVIMLRAMEGLARLGDHYLPASRLVQVGNSGESWVIDNDPPDLPPSIHKIIADRLINAICSPVSEVLSQDVVNAADLDRGARDALKFEKAPSSLLNSWQ